MKISHNEMIEYLVKSIKCLKIHLVYLLGLVMILNLGYI